MIRPDARSRLTTHDLDLITEGLRIAIPAPDRDDAGTDPLDDLLDHPALQAHLLGGSLPGPSPSLLFYVLARRALLRHGVDDRIVADYCAALLREFGVRHRAHQIDRVDDHHHGYIVDIIADWLSSGGERHFKVSVHLGNYALWLAGLFPERIAARQLHRGGPDVGYYEAWGQRGFAEASEHHLAERAGLEHVLHVTATRFTAVRLAFNEVSDQLTLRAA